MNSECVVGSIGTLLVLLSCKVPQAQQARILVEFHSNEWRLTPKPQTPRESGLELVFRVDEGTNVGSLMDAADEVFHTYSFASSSILIQDSKDGDTLALSLNGGLEYIDSTLVHTGYFCAESQSFFSSTPYGLDGDCPTELPHVDVLAICGDNTEVVDCLRRSPEVGVGVIVTKNCLF